MKKKFLWLILPLVLTATALMGASGNDRTIYTQILEVWEAFPGTGKVTIQAPAGVTSYDLTLPAATGSNGQALKLNASGDLEWGTAGGGGGGINYESDPFFQEGLTGWAGSNNTTTLTGGSVSGSTLNYDADDTQIFSGEYKGAATMAKANTGNYAGEGFIKTYTIPNKSQSDGYLFVSGTYSSDSGLSTGDVIIRAYDVTNSEVLTIRGITDGELAGIAAGKVGHFTAKIPLYNDTASIRLGFQWGDTTSSTKDMIFSNINIGPDKFLDMPIYAEWEFTPTGSWTTNTTYTGKIRREDNWAVIQYFIDLSGAPDSTPLDINMPSGLTVDTDLLMAIGFSSAGAQATFWDSSDSKFYKGEANFSNTMRVVSWRTDASSTSSSEPIYKGSVTQSVPFTWASGDTANVTIRVPIAEWANSSAVMSTTEAMNATPSFRLSRSNSVVVADNTTETLPFTSSDVEFDYGGLYNSTTNRIEIQESGRYEFIAKVNFSGVSGRNFGVNLLVNGSAVIADLRPSTASNTNQFSVPSGPLDLSKGDYIEMSAYQNDPSSTGSGTVTSYVLTGNKIQDHSHVGIYGEYEILTATSSEDTLAASSTYQAPTGGTVTLTPGTWVLDGLVKATSESSTNTFTYITGAWSTSSSSYSLSGFTVESGGNGISQLQMDTTAIRQTYYPLPTLVVTVTSDTPIYILTRAAWSAGTSHTALTYLTARRLR